MPGVVGGKAAETIASDGAKVALAQTHGSSILDIVPDVESSTAEREEIC